MTPREILLSVSCLTIGLLVGSWKGDDVVEHLCGVESEIVPLLPPEEITDIQETYNPRVLHYLVKNRPLRTYDMKLASLIGREVDCYRFEVSDYDTSELLAVVRIAYKGEAISGGWVVD